MKRQNHPYIEGPKLLFTANNLICIYTTNGIVSEAILRQKFSRLWLIETILCLVIYFGAQLNSTTHSFVILQQNTVSMTTGTSDLPTLLDSTG